MRSVIVATIFLLTACSTSIEMYDQSTPELKLETFFNGQLKAYGIVQNRSGKVIRRFKADLEGIWTGDKGVLKEDFFFDDGELQHRTWYLEKLPEGRYIGTAEDVIGQAEGSVAGFAMNWTYTLAIPIDGKTWHFTLDDWMYLLDENRLMNRAEMKKFGFRVGELTLWIEQVNSE